MRLLDITAFTLLVSGLLAGFAVQPLHAEDTAQFRAFTRMPVKEVTVFKDGHALVLHEGDIPTDSAGNVVLDYLPAPVIGTFWPYSDAEHVKLRAVTASRNRVQVQRTALNLRELIEANVGARVIITEKPVTDQAALSYEATIQGIPAQSGAESDAISPPYADEHLTQKGDVVLLQTEAGLKVVGFDRILDITFTDDYVRTLAQEEFRNLLTLHLDWQNQPVAPQAAVGLMYVQKGLRWIPNYKITLDGQGQAQIQLQANVINELADLDDVTAHLVIGVPSFAFKDTIDPIALQEAIAQLSPHFQPNAATAYSFDNAIMSQVALNQAPQSNETYQAANLGPEMSDAEKHEDLFLFTLTHITLKKGQRLVVPITEFSLTYRDVYALDVPINPPSEMWQMVNSSRQSEAAQLYQTPKVKHNIRLTNTSDYPLTTAPALIFRDNRVMAQGMLTYAAPGADTDLEMTSAVDVQVNKTENETQRTPNAVKWNHDQYTRIDVEGRLTLTSFKDQPLEVEVTRYVLGNIAQVEQGGQTEMVNVFEDWSYSSGGQRPVWWGWFSWPYWWYHLNSVGRITWNVTLEPQKPLELGYTWLYYWR